MSTIIDNRDENSLLNGLKAISSGGREIKIATAFFSLDALLLLADTLQGYERISILFGDDASAVQRRRLLQMLRERSDDDLLAQRENLPTLTPLRTIEQLFAAGRVEARCYTARKFHAKAYLVDRPTNTPPKLGIIGSGNFTRPGLTQNIELNVKLHEDQTGQLEDWFDRCWSEAAADVVTDDVLNEIRRQLDLYIPYAVYLKALYTWGDQQQVASGPLGRTKLQEMLDPHQEQGYLRALKVIEREHGVMVCDGVGLGKSFIALALMERFCREGKKVLLIAPKNIMSASWDGYIEAYLSDFRQPFGSVHQIPMTALGFDPDGDEASSDAIQAKFTEVQRLFERADVVVIDESHNFRSASADRYKNLLKIVQPSRGKRKDIVLLTATPINTDYKDIGNQLQLITQGRGNIGGYSSDQIRSACNQLDRASRGNRQDPLQLSLELADTPNESLNRVLHSVLMQRSRATCKGLAAAVGKELRFPIRTAPKVIEIELGTDSPHYRELIALASRRFQPAVEFIKQMREALKKADETGKQVLPVSLRNGPAPGIKLAAFLTEQYRVAGATDGANRRVYQNEVHLAALVFANTLKQLESSPVAFQGILQSIGTGLVARLRHVFGDSVSETIAEHEPWLRTLLFDIEEDAQLPDVDTDYDIEEDGETLDASGGESDAWLAQAVKERQLYKKLRGFDKNSFDIERWRRDIVSDLGFLREIHAATLKARKQPDPKMAHVLPEIRALVEAGKRVLVFTQSQRTSEYLQRIFKKNLVGTNVARIDSRVEQTRPAILHAFCPGYNAPASAASVPPHVEVLISTDVLSEGVNLQEAGAILSYDIHWNPVRLIQRIGRVDRRLNPMITPEDHSFDIINVVPPREIDDIINLVGTVENRTLRISRTLGLDVSFFSSADPSGNLIEFNAQYEGHVPAAERALSEYARLAVTPPDARTKAILDIIPPGAFGVWQNAPRNGLFAMFTMEPKRGATEADRTRFASVLGQPVLILENDPPAARPITDAGDILTLLQETAANPSSQSGVPSDEEQLKQRLAKLKTHVRRGFSQIELPSSIVPKLVCWMELRKAQD